LRISDVGTTRVLPASFDCSLTPEEIAALDRFAIDRTYLHHLDHGCGTWEVIKASRTNLADDQPQKTKN
jgi:hypothetical protein